MGGTAPGAVAAEYGGKGGGETQLLQQTKEGVEKGFTFPGPFVWMSASHSLALVSLAPKSVDGWLGGGW